VAISFRVVAASYAELQRTWIPFRSGRSAAMPQPRKRSRPHPVSTKPAGPLPGPLSSPSPAAGSPGPPPAASSAESSGATPAGRISTRELLAVGSALLLLLFLIKIYGVGRYSLTTTTALLAATPFQVALGTVTIYAYYVLPAVALGTVWFAVRYRDRVQPALWPLILIVVTVTALASPFKYLLRGLAVVLLALTVELVIRRLRHRWARSTAEHHVRRRQTLAGWQGLSVVYLGAAALSFQFMHSLDAPWVSAQAFLLNTAAVPATQQMRVNANQLRVVPESRFVGYPIAETEEWVTILHADTRYVMRIPQSSIDTRLTCHNEDDQLAGDRPLLEALQGNSYNSPNLDCRKVLTYLSRKLPGQPLPTLN
jgi:hypothetical protein